MNLSVGLGKIKAHAALRNLYHRVISCVFPKRRYNERMKTLTITEGRGRLGYWLKKAVAGDDIGFILGNKIVALRPVEVHSDDYALQEYRIAPTEMQKAERRIRAEIKAARARGEVTKFTGGKDDFR
ncbi:MAG TPA: hypothetical protein VGN23_00985 [Verrucomicrobiae bacterium]